MKKKIILLMLIAFILFGGMDNVNAGVNCYGVVKDGVQIIVGGDGASSITGGRPLDNQGACEWGRYSPDTSVNAVRLTIVDKTGGRVSSSIDVYSGSQPSVPGYYRVSTEKKYRNELISSHTGYTTASRTSISLVAFPTLPTFRNADAGAATLLKNYFTTMFATRDTAEMQRIFALMGYTGYTDETIYDNHLLLIEPIFKTSMDVPTGGTNGCRDRNYIETSAYYEVDRYSRQHNISFSTALNVLLRNGTISYRTTQICNCSLSTTYYYGTATEIFSMMEQSQDPILQYKVGSGGSIETIVHNLGGLIHDDQDLGGLKSASSIFSTSDGHVSGAYNHRRDEYGLGTMHIWMKQIMEGCNDNNLCSNFCPPPYEKIEIFPDDTPEMIDAKCPMYCPAPHQDVRIYRTDTPEKINEKCGGCDLTPDVKLTNNCLDGPNGSVKDKEDWKCIFKTKDKDKNTFEGNFYNVHGLDLSTNRYCSVACREEINYRFSYPFTTYAGNKFTIASSCSGGGDKGFEIVKIDPGTMSGKSVCRTAPKEGTDIANAKINYTQFANEYKIANDNVAAAWDNLQKLKLLQKSTDNAVESGPTYGGEHTFTCQDHYEGGCISYSCSNGTHNVPGSAAAAWVALEHAHGNNSASCSCEEHGEGPEKSKADCPPGRGGYNHDGNETWTYKTYTGPTYYYTDVNGNVSSHQVTYYVTSCGDAHGLATKPDYSSAISIAQGAYDYAVAVREGLLNMINQCNNFVRDYSDFDPEVTFAYKDPTYGGSFPLEKHGSITTSTTEFYKDGVPTDYSCNWLSGDCTTGNANGKIAPIATYFCDTTGEACKSGQVNYPVNDYVVQTVVKTYTFDLNMNKYRYMGKNGLQADSPSSYSNIEYNESYKNFNCPVFPISFNYSYCETRNEYAYKFYFGYDPNQKNLFGENDKFTKYSDSIGLESGNVTDFEGNFAEKIDYKCEFHVYQEFKQCYECNENSSNWNPTTRTCGNGDDDCCAKGTCDCGINIIYRPISLDNPFPGEHGKTKNQNGRAPGDNWNWSFTNKTGATESAVHAYITNNRGVHTEEVYNETPIYEFILDTSNIRKIRKYNSQQKHNYTDEETLECYGETAEFCQSTFLKNGITNGYFQFTNENPTGGTCFGKTGTTDDEWNACRYTHQGG